MTEPLRGTTSQADDEAAIRKLVDTWLAASKAGDIATVLSLMTDDVVFMVPGREPFGKEAFAAASDAMRNVRIEGKSEIREIWVLGDWAYLRTYIEMAITPEAWAAGKAIGPGQWRSRGMQICWRESLVLSSEPTTLHIAFYKCKTIL
jgi:uncharacterized protein (TIGR02246 family)